jgi:hypothetical protein
VAGRPIYPIVIDDVPLPGSVADLYAIDLRGLGAATPREALTRTLQPLIDQIRRGRHDARMLLQP